MEMAQAPTVGTELVMNLVADRLVLGSTLIKQADENVVLRFPISRAPSHSQMPGDIPCHVA